MRTDEEIEREFDRGNNAGEGIEACGCEGTRCDCDAETIGLYLDAEYVGLTAGRGLRVFRDGARLFAVGDVHGPWAVRMDAGDES